MPLDRWGNRPVHLFVFTRQHLVWRYCTADRDIEVDGKIYLSAQIERSEIKQTIERAKDRLTIKFAYLLDPDAVEFPVTQSLGDNWWPHVPGDVVAVTCMAYNFGSGKAPEVEWMGQVAQPKFGTAEVELVCEPGNGYGRARGQGLRWQRGCTKTVYSVGPRGCNLGVEAGAREITGIVTKIEAVNGDVAPQAHVLVPELAAYIQSLPQLLLRWAPDRSSVVSDAFIAYTEEIERLPFGPNETNFRWEPIGDRTDYVIHDNAFKTYYRYIRHPALVLVDATGLAIGSSVFISIPAVAISGTVTAVSGLLISAAEFAGSGFELAGGFITFAGPNGLVLRHDIAEHVLGSSMVTLTPGGIVPKVGDVVVALPTCARTWAACGARANTDNYGGSVYKPIKSPLDGVSMSWG